MSKYSRARRIDHGRPTPRQSNDTLDNNNCPNSKSNSTVENAWLAYFAANATARLNAAAPGTHLNVSDTLNLMQLCPFDSEVYGTLSPWCTLFTKQEWKNLE